MNTHEALKSCGDVLSVGIIVSTLIGWLPHIAAAVSILYGMVRLWETDTVKGLTGRAKKEKADGE